MTDDLTLLADTTRRFLEDAVTQSTLTRAAAGDVPAALWDGVAGLGILQPAVPEALGGAGGGVEAERVVLSAAGYAAAPLPLAETMLAGWLLSAAGRPVPIQPMTVIVAGAADGWRVTGRAVSGTARRVPWASRSDSIVVLCDETLAVIPTPALAVTPGRNLAGESRDDVVVADVAPAWIGKAPVDPIALRARGALMRATQMAAAIARTLELTTAYARQRVQFGRPIGRFQAVQHQLAILAGQAAAAQMAVTVAYRALQLGPGAAATFAAALAKARAGEAAAAACAIGHQVHGAMGYTQEHMLHHLTKRLQAWRAEFGSEAYWQEYAGAQVLQRGADALWPTMTDLLEDA